jgi:hypothetical protein
MAARKTRPHRDAKGRFCKAPQPPLLAPELVRALGQDRKPAILWMVDVPKWRLRIPPGWRPSNRKSD